MSATMHKERVRPNDTTLIETMESMINHLGQLEQEALRLAITADFGRDQDVAESLATPRRSPPAAPPAH